jgi:hydroxyacylglutathione hydrolase
MKEMFSFFSSVFGSKGSPERITAGELLAMIEGKEKLTLIDVRTQAEFKDGHIPGSVSLPLDTLASALVDAPGRVVVCCASGMRSLSGKEILESKGFRDVVDLKGGLKAWAKEGGRIVRG